MINSENKAIELTIKELKKRAAYHRAEADKCLKLAGDLSRMIASKASADRIHMPSFFTPGNKSNQENSELDCSDALKRGKPSITTAIADFLKTQELDGIDGCTATEIYEGMLNQGYWFRHVEAKKNIHLIHAAVHRNRGIVFAEPTDGKIRLKHKETDSENT